MRAWLIRFGTLYVFDLVVLLLIGLLLPPVSVGWAALWGAVVLTAATIWIKPALTRWFDGRTARSRGGLTRVGAKLVQAGAVFVVAWIVWILVVLLSGVQVAGFFWGYIIPPVLLLIAWLVYDLVDDRLEHHAGRLYDSMRGTDQAGPESPSAPSDGSSAP